MDGQLLFNWHLLTRHLNHGGGCYYRDRGTLSKTEPLSRSFWQGGEDQAHMGEFISQDRTLCVHSVLDTLNGLTLILSSRPFKTHFLNGWKDRKAAVLCPTSTLPSTGENSKYCSRALGPDSSAWKLKLNFPVLIKVNSHWTHSFNSTWEVDNRAACWMNAKHGSILWDQGL